MRYVGSKNKLGKELVPILQDIINENGVETYIEPFVGGANMIDKIRCDKKIGIDIHEELIALLNYTKDNYNNIQDRIYEEEYKWQRVNSCTREFTDYIYNDKGEYLIGGKEVANFVKDAEKLLYK